MEIFVPGALYYHADEIYIKSKLADYGVSDEIIGLLDLTDYPLCTASRMLIEKSLESKGLLCRSESQMIESFLKGETYLFTSLHIANPEMMFVPAGFEPYACGMKTYFRYGYEKIRVNLWMRRIWQECQFLGLTVRKIEDIEFYRIKELNFLGAASWDIRKKEIDLIPFIITDVSVQNSSAE